MIDYGFQAVRDSLKDMERFHAKSVLARGITKTCFAPSTAYRSSNPHSWPVIAGRLAESPTTTRANDWQLEYFPTQALLP
jgi:hypothetical protein